MLRGFHYQKAPHEQGKLVRVTQGAAFDAAVDIRPGSPTFGKSAGIRLNAENQSMLWIPAGFAHGFFALKMIPIFYTKLPPIIIRIGKQSSIGRIRTSQ